MKLRETKVLRLTLQRETKNKHATNTQLKRQNYKPLLEDAEQKLSRRMPGHH